MRRLLVITLASLAALGVVFAIRPIRPHAKEALFTFSVTPTHQSAARGGAARFRVSLVRTGGFTGATALRVAGLPPGVRPRWQLANGTRSGVVPLARTGATLTLRTSARTPLGTRRAKVFATGGGTTRARELTLTVERRRARHFTLGISPASQTVPQGAIATYKVHVTRVAGFRRRVTLRVLSVPRGARATLSPTMLTVATRADQRLGRDRLVVEGTNRVGERAFRRYAAVVLTVVRGRQFPISGDLTTPLYPGASAPLDLNLTNPHDFDIRATTLSVSVGAGTTNSDCSGDVNYGVTQYSGGYPLVLHPGSTPLSALVSNSSLWPQISMHNLPTNQDACKNAILSLHYKGLATR